MIHPIGIIGLGYVGLPLAIEFSKKYRVKAFDKSENRISQLKKENDITNQLTKKELNKIRHKIHYTNDIHSLKSCGIFHQLQFRLQSIKIKNRIENLESASINISKIIKEKGYSSL